MRIFIETYGCTLNRADSEIMKGILLSKGASLAADESEADVIILNTCTVKTPTEQRIMQRISALSGKPLVIAGCMPSVNLRQIENAAPNASMVGASSLTHIFDAASAAFAGKKKIFFDKDAEEKLLLPKLREGVARIPIAEGCLGSCSFCATKFARGRLHSYPEKLILLEIENCVKAGFKDIQLTAQDTGAYGLDIGTTLPHLLRQIGRISGDFSVRVGMMNPEHALKFLPELLSAYKSQKIKKFLHLPLQSGSNKILRDMKRNYTAEEFLKIALAFRKQFPEMTLSTDIIAGFPTESEEDFQKTLDVLEKIKPDVLNLSKFGARPHTEAAALKQLSPKTIKERSRLISKLFKA